MSSYNVVTKDLYKTTPISLIKCNVNEKDNQSFKEYALNLKDKQNKNTNVKGDMSSWRIWEETDTYNPILDDILYMVNNQIIEWMQPPIVNISTKEKGNYFIEDAWIACYNKNDHTLEHCHRPSIASFVYCVNGNDGHPPLVFRGNPDVEIKLTTNDLVIFPSETLHYVPASLSEETRVVLAGNIHANGIIAEFLKVSENE